MTRRWALVGGVAAALFASPALLAPLDVSSIYDGGITSAAGTFVRHGLMPYRDFWLLYGPLPAYLAALVGTVAHDDLIPLRALGHLVVGLTGAVATSIALRYVAPAVAVTLGVFASVSPVAYFGLDFAPWSLAMACALGAVALAMSNSRRRLLFAGLLCGVAGLARQDLGVYSVIAISLGYRSLVPLGASLLIWLPTGLLILLQVPFSDLWAQLVAYPLVGSSQFRALPVPSLTEIGSLGSFIHAYLYYVPIAVAIAALVTIARTRDIRPATFALLVIVILTRPQASLRADTAHAAMTFAPSLLLAASLGAQISLSFLRRLVAGLSLAPLAILVLALPGVSAAPASDYARAVGEAAQAVRSLTAPEEPIFVGLTDHRYAYSNPLVIYYLADRSTAVRDSMFNPGVTNTDETASRLVADLTRTQVRFLVLDRAYAYCRELVNQSRNAGSSILDEYIDRDFRPIIDFGQLVIMARRGVEGAAPAPAVVSEPILPRAEGTLWCER